MKTASEFDLLIQKYEEEMQQRIQDLRSFADRVTNNNNPTQIRRKTKLSWFDELANIEENINTSMEFSRNSVRLETLVGLAEKTLDSLERAVQKAEDVAVLKYNFEPIQVLASSESENIAATPVKKQEQRIESQHNSSTIFSEPPTPPSMDKLGLSSRFYHLLQEGKI